VGWIHFPPIPGRSDQLDDPEAALTRYFRAGRTGVRAVTPIPLCAAPLRNCACVAREVSISQSPEQPYSESDNFDTSLRKVR
jgi:hypothetical protein